MSTNPISGNQLYVHFGSAYRSFTHAGLFLDLMGVYSGKRDIREQFLNSGGVLGAIFVELWKNHMYGAIERTLLCYGADVNQIFKR